MDQISFGSEATEAALGLEQLTRPLLTLLSQVTGMESTYLTTIDVERGLQHVAFAHNIGSMTIPEGLSVPWSDTLCKRALDENRMYSDNVAECWGDSDAAAALGIKTYMSAPIRSRTGKLLGTVCAASGRQIPRLPDVEPLLLMLSGLMSYALERELLVEELTAKNAELSSLALTDALTGLPNRRSIMNDLEHLLALAEREKKYVLVSLIDLDGFKSVNDTHGHLAGDHLLRGIACRLQEGLRSSDLIGRAGGDEFIVIALGASVQNPALEADMRIACETLQERLAKSTMGLYELGDGLSTIKYAGASVGVVAVIPGELSVEQAVELADKEMYRVKHFRVRH